MKERITRIVNGLPEGTRPTHEAEPAISRTDAEGAEKAKSDGGQENLPDNVSNILG
jgi:hypothetical protein